MFGRSSRAPHFFAPPPPPPRPAELELVKQLKMGLTAAQAVLLLGSLGAFLEKDSGGVVFFLLSGLLLQKGIATSLEYAGDFTQDNDLRRVAQLLDGAPTPVTEVANAITRVFTR